MKQSFRTSADQPLEIPFDVEERIAAIPRSATIKGMFMTPVIDGLGAELEAHLPRLQDPPKAGKYLAFHNYPQADCARLAFALARKTWPKLPHAEACRRLGRRDIQNFRASTLGRVTLSLLGDPESTLMKLPDVYGMILNGGGCRAERHGAGVRLVYAGISGTLDNLQIGTVEGIVMNYGKDPVIDVHMEAHDRAVFEVRWT
jgi:uncharacterized protein (TIGR02265 family)